MRDDIMIVCRNRADNEQTVSLDVNNSLNSDPPPSNSVARKKARKTNPGILQSPRKLALEESCPVVIRDGEGPLGNEKTKRRRKQKIDTLPDDIYDLTQDHVEKPKRKRAKTTSDSDKIAKSRKKCSVSNNSVVAQSTISRTSTKGPTTDTSKSLEYKQSVLSEVRLPSNLTFKVFPDLTRNLAAIGPSEVVIAVDSTCETGLEQELRNEGANSTDRVNSELLWSQFVSVPHFLPLTSVYSAGEPFSRILRFSELEQFTSSKQCKNHVSTFRFYGPRYAKQVQPLTLPPKDSQRVVEETQKNKDGYRCSDLIIKHPILGFYCRKVVSLKFIVLKRIPGQGNIDRVILKAKDVQLRRSSDLKNIEIYVNECSIPDKALDVSAMNQQNLHPVLQTASGIVPVIGRTSYVSVNPVNQQYTHQPQYHYVEYQTSEIVHDQYDNSITTEYILSPQNTTTAPQVSGDYFGNFRTEDGTQLVFLNPSSTDLSTFIQQGQGHQLVLQQEHNLYPVTEQTHFQAHIQPQIQPLRQPVVQQLQFAPQQPQISYSTPVQQQSLSTGQEVQGKILGHVFRAANGDPIFVSQNNDGESSADSTQLSLPPIIEQQFLQRQQTQTSQFSCQTSPSLSAPSSSIIIQPSGSYQKQQFVVQSSPSPFPTNCDTRQATRHVAPSTSSHQISTIVQDSPQPSQVQLLTHEHVHHHQQDAAFSQVPLVVKTQPQASSAIRTYKGFEEQRNAIAASTFQTTKTIVFAEDNKQKPKTKKPKSDSKLSQPFISVPQQVEVSQQKVPLGLSTGTTNLKVGDIVRFPKTKSGISPVPVGSPNFSTQNLAASASLSLATTTSPSKPSVSGSLGHLSPVKNRGVNAAKSQVQSALPVVSTTSVSTNSTPPKVCTTPKVFTVVSSPRAPAPTPVTRVAVQPGYLAVCPHCGLCCGNVTQCDRCKTKFPGDVRLVQNCDWKVKGDTIVVPTVKTTAAATSTLNASKSASSSISSDKSLPVAVSRSGDSKSSTVKPGVRVNKRIILIDKPPCPIVKSTPTTTAKLSTGSVQIQIQKDGGSSVTIVKNPVINRPPVVKKRASTRRKTQECITLSSDDEESEPKPKVSKTEVEPDKPPQQEGATPDKNIPSSMGNKQSNSSTTNEQKPISSASPETMKKRMSINLTLNPAESLKKEESITSPDDVLKKITDVINQSGSKIQHVMLDCRSIRVGSYKVTSSDLGFDIPVTFTDLGIKFTIPNANMKRKHIQTCIPMEVILEIKAHLNKKLPVVFVTTGPRYAKWLREKLSMDGSPSSETSNYYCPMNGGPCQKQITFLLNPTIADADVGAIKAIANQTGTFHEISLGETNQLLMKITPQSFKSSIAYKDPSGSTPNSPEASSVSLEVKAPVTTPASKSTNSSTSTQVNTASCKTSVSGDNSNASEIRDSEGMVLFIYEGRNNIKVPICPKDISCLGAYQFLNDQIIDFWMTVIQTELMSDEDIKRTFVFDSFFYSKLTEKGKKRPSTIDESKLTPGERRHARVKKRTKNVDIFEKDFLIIPINENYHWFIAVICFPGLQGYHDYDTLEPLPNYKKVRLSTKSKTAVTSTNKPVVSKQPKHETTASYSDRDEAPEDPEEAAELNSVFTDSPASAVNSEGTSTETESSVVEVGAKRKLNSANHVKHPCILIFDSLAGESRARVYSTLREYLKIEYKIKKNADRVFDKNTIPGYMPKVPQQPNFHDCGLFMLQYVESFFSSPIETYDQKEMNLKSWFQPSIAANKRKELFDFITKKIEQRAPHNVSYIPQVSFDEDDDEDLTAVEDEDSKVMDPDFTVKRKNSESVDHTYAKGADVLVSSPVSVSTRSTTQK